MSTRKYRFHSRSEWTILPIIEFKRCYMIIVDCCAIVKYGNLRRMAQKGSGKSNVRPEKCGRDALGELRRLEAYFDAISKNTTLHLYYVPIHWCSC